MACDVKSVVIFIGGITMVMNKVCVDCGVSPEDTPEKCLTVIIDERRLECCICESCKNKRSNKP